MEVLAEKIPEEVCREVVSGAMGALLPEVEYIRVPRGLAAGLWGAVHEGEDLTAEPPEGLREVVLAAEVLAEARAEAPDTNTDALIYPPTQRTTPACRNAIRRAGTGLPVDECVNCS